MVGWKTKVREILPENKGFEEKPNKFKHNLAMMFELMKNTDITVKMLTFEYGNLELPVHAVFKLNSIDQLKYLKINEVTKRQYIEVYINVKSQKRYFHS